MPPAPPTIPPHLGGGRPVEGVPRLRILLFDSRAPTLGRRDRFWSLREARTFAISSMSCKQTVVERQCQHHGISYSHAEKAWKCPLAEPNTSPRSSASGGRRD